MVSKGLNFRNIDKFLLSCSSSGTNVDAMHWELCRISVFQITMYTIESDGVSSEDGIEKGQCYHIVKRSLFSQNCSSVILCTFSKKNAKAIFLLWLWCIIALCLRSSCLNSVVNSLFVNMKKPPVELKTTEKVLELLQPTRYKPSTVSLCLEKYKM